MANVRFPRPGAGDVAPFHMGYVEMVAEGDLLQLLERQGDETRTLLQGLSEEQSRHRYAAGKWSIRELVGHVIDAERVFAYRALRFARGDQTPLPGFDEVAWGSTSNADRRSLGELVQEFSAVRAATLALFRGFSEVETARAGTASGYRVTVTAIAHVVAGHERHHMKILKERYLSS